LELSLDLTVRATIPDMIEPEDSRGVPYNITGGDSKSIDKEYVSGFGWLAEYIDDAEL
jgi:hypothetical protein